MQYPRFHPPLNPPLRSPAPFDLLRLS